MTNFKIVLIDCSVSILAVIVYLVVLVNAITAPGASTGLIPVMVMLLYIPVTMVLGMFSNFNDISRTYLNDTL